MTTNNSLKMDFINVQSMFKPSCMTIFMHDYAYQKEKVEIFPFIYLERPRPTQSVERYDIYSMEFIRELTNEQLGALIRHTLEGIDSAKQEIQRKDRD